MDPLRSDLFARLPGEGRPREVLRVGLDGLDLGADERALPGDGVLPLQLVSPRRRLPALRMAPDGVPGTATSGRLSLRFLDHPLPVFRQLVHELEDLRRRGFAAPVGSPPAVTESTADPARVREILRALVACGTPGTLVAGPGRVLPARPLPPCPGDRRPLRFAVEGVPAGPPRLLRLPGFVSVFEVPVEDPAFEAGVLCCALPSSLKRVRRRDERRCAAPRGLEVSFRHPVWPQVEVRRPAHDLSPHGLSFRTRAAEDLPMPGLDLPEVRLLRDGVEVARLDGQVRRVAPTPCGGPLVAGLRVRPATGAEARRWLEVAQDVMTPAARTRGTPVGDSWSLFTESGYFGLSSATPEQFRQMQQDFDRCARKVDAAPDLGCQAVFPSDRGIECSFTAHRVYQGTYFPGQLAKRKGGRGDADSRTILRDVHRRMYEHLQHDPDLRWLLVFLHDSTRWTQAAYRDFPRRHFATGDAWMHPFDAWAADCTVDDGGPRDASLSFGDPDLADRHALVRAAAESRSPLYAEALDLVPSRLDLASLSARWARAGLERRRVIRVARRDGRALAAAVMETGEVGTHLFHMYDTVRLFALAPGGHEAYGDLLREARRWYAAQGRRAAVYCREDGDAGHAQEAGWKPLGGARLLVMSTRILPDFLECVHEVTAPGGVALTVEERDGEAGQAA